jgi:D-aspartate ligase
MSDLQSQFSAAVFCAESYNALAVTRSLGRRGVRVISLGQEARSIAFHSRYTAESVIYPDPVLDEARFVDVLRHVGMREKAAGRRIIAFPTSDRLVKLFSERREELGAWYEFGLPSRAAVEASLDKLAQYGVAERIGVPYPRTYATGDLERLRADFDAGRVAAPLFLKARVPLDDPSLSRFRRMRLSSRAEAEARVSEAERLNVPFVVQEVIPGGDDQLYTLGSTMDRNGQLVAAFTGRKLRQMPPGFGICRVGENRAIPELAELGRRLLAALGFHGISQVEFKYDARDGQFKLMEVNPRTWSWVGLPIELGADLPWAEYSQCAGMPLEPQRGLPNERALWISLTHDIERSLQHRDGVPLAHLFRGYERVVEAYYAGDDPVPGMVHFGQTLREWSGRVLRKLAKGRG